MTVPSVSWALPAWPYSQEENLFTVDWSGFVLNSAYVDTRQILNFRDELGSRNGYILVLPKPIDEDVNGNDINAKGQSNIMPIYSRLSATITGPDAGQARCLSVIEGDFLGTEDITIECFRLRDAFIQLDWERFSFFTGQIWHPITFPYVAPDTISIAYGVPINAYARNPQLRLEYKTENYTILGAALSQVIDINNGPCSKDDIITHCGQDPLFTQCEQDPIVNNLTGHHRSGIYARNAIIQNIHGQFIWYPREHVHLGIGGDYKRLVPRLVSNQNIKVDESISSFCAIAYADLYYDELRATAKFIYSESGDCYNLLGGYAVHSIDPITDKRTYTNLRYIGCWLDIYAVGKIEPGMFIGVTKNVGAAKTIIPCIEQDGKLVSLVYGYGTEVDYLFRVSPRLRILFDPFTVGFEVEYNRAAYGRINTQGEVVNTRPVGAIRCLVGFYYFF